MDVFQDNKVGERTKFTYFQKFENKIYQIKRIGIKIKFDKKKYRNKKYTFLSIINYKK